MGTRVNRFLALRLVAALCLMVFSAASFGKAEWLGIYMMGQKIGYSVTRTEPSDWNGIRVEKSTSHLEIGTQMLGSAMQITVDSTSLTDEDGQLRHLVYRMSSAGRIQQTTALFEGRTIKASMIAGGSESTRTLTVPEGKRLVDDPVALVLQGKVKDSADNYVIFSPETMELVEIAIRVGKPEQIEVKGVSTTATPIVVDDPRAPSTVFLSAKGDLVKVVGPMGLEMIPESEADATRDSGPVNIDLASVSSIRPQGRFDPGAESIRIRITSDSLKSLPSDRRQTAKKTDLGWELALKRDIEPNAAATIASTQGMSAWLKPEPRVPSDSEQFQTLAKEVIGDETRVAAAAYKIHDYVHDLMGVNAGIGVMRDAAEILETKEGVCRDHAILTGTLLRAAGIPTRFVNGLVFAEGAFYYHAWVEFWDGSNWIGLDSTRSPKRLGVGYIKTAQGSVGQALVGFLIDGARIEVLGK